MSHKKFIVYSSVGDRKDFHITGNTICSARAQAFRYYEDLLRKYHNQKIEVVFGREEWYRISDNQGTI